MRGGHSYMTALEASCLFSQGCASTDQSLPPSSSSQASTLRPPPPPPFLHQTRMASLLARAASGFSTRLTRGKNEEGRLATPPTAKQRAYSLRFPLPPSTHDSRESTPPSHYPYHPNGKEAGRTGYVGSLTEDQVKAIMTIKVSEEYYLAVVVAAAIAVVMVESR